ncbi:metallophosphoesterase family protein [Pseudomonas sp. 18173]|uniref:metallophosphoesterase family protein n=1 Tax=Pseudomonas sp. 18173 TaxID=3390055 RepID=UPI003D1FA493
MKVGVISDTHGLLRPEAISALQGCDCIVHAGDIGSAQILEQLAAIAPVHAVRGNNDLDAPWARGLPDCLRLDLNGWTALLVHDIADVAIGPDERIDLVITGHSHKPCIDWRAERLFLNPGSAGRRRFKLPVTLALLEVRAQSIEPRLVSLLE